MKRLFLFFISIVMALMASAQTQQKGVAYKYNGKNQRTPLGNVSISYDNNKRSTLSGAQDGEFSLLLTSLKMGDRIGAVTVKKREMMVFNQNAVDEWSVRKEPLVLILRNAEEFEQQKQNLIAIGKREAKKKYDQQKSELEQQLKDSKIKQQEYETALDKAYDELERLQKNVGDYADLFARIDESEIDTLAQRAMELYNQGLVDEAIRLFEQGNYMEKLDKAIQTSQQADELKAKAEQAKELATQDSLKAIQSLQAQVRAYIVQGDFHKAGQVMKGMADRIYTVDYLSWYADFICEQKDYAEAEIYWRKTLEQLDNELEHDSEEYLHRQAVTLRELGTALNAQKNFVEAETALAKAANIHKFLYEKDSMKYDRKLVISLTALGNFYENTMNYEKAIDTYQKALVVDRKIAESDSSYNWNVSLVLNNLAVIYMRLRRYQESEDIYLQAKEIQQKYVLSYPDWEFGKKNYSGLLFNLGIVYLNRNQLDLCEEAFKEAIKLCKELMDKNPDAYTPYYCMYLVDYGRLEDKLKHFQESKQKYLEAIQLYRVLEESHPWVYSGDLARTLENYGTLCSNLGDYEESEKYLLESYEIRKKLAQRYPNIYSVKVVNSLDCLISMARESSQFEKGEQWGQEMMSIVHTLVDENPDGNQDVLARALLTMGNFYGDAGKSEESIPFLKECVDVCKQMAIARPAHLTRVSQALYNLGLSYIDVSQWENAKLTFEESLEWLDKIEKGNYESDKADTYYWLGAAYVGQKKYVDAVYSFQNARDLYRHLAVSNPQYYSPRTAFMMGVGMAFYSIFLKKYAEAEQYAREALAIDSSSYVIYTNLAAAQLFQGKYNEAEKIYRQYKTELKDNFLDDFKQFAEAGVIPKEREADVEKIKQLLNE
ncbi:MAG: tetratricopeptide repeat protein [Prevotella sp.]|nr:tetratricopeptide repeat protein [Prevotella sp.]